MIIKRSIRFILKKQKKSNSRIIMRVAYIGKSMDFQTGIVVDERNFDKKSQCLTGCTLTSSEVIEKNDRLAMMKSAMITVFHNCELKEQIPTPEFVRSAYNSLITPYLDEEPVLQKTSGTPSVTTTNIKKDVNLPKTEKTFWVCFDEFVRVNSKLNDWTDATREKFSAIRNHLYDFNKKLTFDYFDEDGIANYITYLGRKKMKNSTINKQLGFLRWFLRWCLEKGYHDNRTFEYYKPKLKNAKKRVIFLTEEEIEQLEKFKIPKKRVALEPARDVFLFCCYTGLRHSDVYNLTWADVHDGKIEIVTKKTVDRLVIELNKKSKAIIRKYSDISFPKHKVLPVVCNQKMNKYLHELCQLAGLDAPIKITHYEGNKRVDEVKPKYELIGTHTGRRTFICLALSKGIPPTVVMKWTGHSDYKAMKPYIDVADEVKESYMKRFDEPNETNEDKQKNEDEQKNETK